MPGAIQTRPAASTYRFKAREQKFIPGKSPHVPITKKTCAARQCPARMLLQGLGFFGYKEPFSNSNGSGSIISCPSLVKCRV